MTAAIRPKDLTSSTPFGADHEKLGPSISGMRRASLTADDAREQYDVFPDLPHGKSGDASSLEGDCPSPRVTRTSVPAIPALPPLHPQLQASVHSQSFRRCRTLSADTLTSTGSSVISIDAGKHGFITHDDASATGSLVLGYEQGEIPPAEYDLPKAILGSIDVENRSVGYSVESGEDFQKLPYQIRSRLSMTHIPQEERPPEKRRWSNIPDINISTGYGAIEEGLMQIQDRAKANHCNNYPSPDNGSTAPNTLCYSTETSPFFESRGEMYSQHSHCAVPEQLQMPTTWTPEEHLPSIEGREGSSSSQTNVYLSMLLILVLFVGMIYGLFTVMKVMA